MLPNPNKDIDNKFAGGQNGTAGTQFTHVLAILNSIAATTRAMTKRLPPVALQGSPSDFAPTYRQATDDPEKAHLFASSGHVRLLQQVPLCWFRHFPVVWRQVRRLEFMPHSSSVLLGHGKWLKHATIAWTTCSRYTEHQLCDLHLVLGGAWRGFANRMFLTPECAHPGRLFEALGTRAGHAVAPEKTGVARILKARCEKSLRTTS